MDWDVVSYVTGGELRFRILVELNKNRRTPSQLAKETKSPISHISSTLKELEQKEIVRCLTPGRRKNKFYEVTDFGKELLDFINRETKIKTTSRE